MSSRDTDSRVAALVQARLGSTRLPGKVFAPLVDGKSVLEYLLDRLASCRKLSQIIVATTTEAGDDRLAAWLAEKGIAYFRGSEADCLDRLYRAATKFGVEIIVRITSDCPLAVPEVVDEMVAYYLENAESIDYLSNRQFTNYPEGVDVEIFTRAMLRQAAVEAVESREREHINYFFLERPEQFRIRYYNHGLSRDYSNYKLSVDTQADLDLLIQLFSRGLPRDFTFRELAVTLDRLGNPATR
jgi:spore coat polysaccharide biosynthesis protein SpsF